MGDYPPTSQPPVKGFDGGGSGGLRRRRRQASGGFWPHIAVDLNFGGVCSWPYQVKSSTKKPKRRLRDIRLRTAGQRAQRAPDPEQLPDELLRMPLINLKDMATRQGLYKL